jgi:hypothetical protein
MIYYKWVIEKIVVTGNTNLVTQVHWRCDAANSSFPIDSAALDVLMLGSAGVENLNASDTFIPYNDLTEQQVLDWCFAPKVITLADQTTVTKLLKNNVEAQLAEQMAIQVAKKTTEPVLPWQKIPA